MQLSTVHMCPSAGQLSWCYHAIVHAAAKGFLIRIANMHVIKLVILSAPSMSLLFVLVLVQLLCPVHLHRCTSHKTNNACVATCICMPKFTSHAHGRDGKSEAISWYTLNDTLLAMRVYKRDFCVLLLVFLLLTILRQDFPNLMFIPFPPLSTVSIVAFSPIASNPLKYWVAWALIKASFLCCVLGRTSENDLPANKIL